ncbi:kinase-like domain-containing protein [Aspergillus avenaceus]|uniref:Kinase-like domain-containing protein n=1 Tax=Aspergillus avenaceus TaxID=36643 RepID=A0A5N6TK24_ASPAV|nr:kinase-like domain-containing protein [Aspergillus avenaceus]
MASSLFIDLHGQPIAESETLGYGRSGVVMRRGNSAIKIPLRHPWSTDADVQLNTEVVQHEQEVYRRLTSSEKEQIDGVVSCIELCTNTTRLAFMENGDLRTYLEKNKPSRSIQVAWFYQMARALAQVHNKCVLVADIATRNFLLDSDLSIRLCDFSEASVLPLGTAMELVDDAGYSIQTDIGQLGAVMYEVITGQKCEFDLFQNNSPDDGQAHWPQRASLPSTDGLWLGSIIEKYHAARSDSPIVLFLVFQRHLPYEDEGTPLSPRQSSNNVLTMSFSFLSSIERVVIVERVCSRLCYVAFCLMKDCVQRDGFCYDSILFLSDEIRQSEKLCFWVGRGDRLWRIPMDLGGPGILFFLSEDVGENVYAML